MKIYASCLALSIGVVLSQSALADLKPLEKITATTTLSLPSDTEIFGVSEDGAIDSFLSAKFSVSSEELGALLEAADLDEDDFEDSKRYLLGQDDDWWDPQTPKTLPTAQKMIAPGRVLNLGVDYSSCARPVIYLVWHST